MEKEYCKYHKNVELKWRKDRKGKYCPICIGELTIK